LLALFLVLLSLITYFIFGGAHCSEQTATSRSFPKRSLSTVQAEMLDSHGPDAPRLAVQEAIVEHHYRDHVFAVFDPSGGMLASFAGPT